MKNIAIDDKSVHFFIHSSFDREIERSTFSLEVNNKLLTFISKW